MEMILYVFNKWKKLIYLFSAEIIMLDRLTCVYRSSVDLYFCVVGSLQENEVCGRCD